MHFFSRSLSRSSVWTGLMKVRLFLAPGIRPAANRTVKQLGSVYAKNRTVEGPWSRCLWPVMSLQLLLPSCLHCKPKRVGGTVQVLGSGRVLTSQSSFHRESSTSRCLKQTKDVFHLVFVFISSCRLLARGHRSMFLDVLFCAAALLCAFLFQTVLQHY